MRLEIWKDVHAVSLGNGPNVLGCSKGPKNGSLLLVVSDSLASKKGATTLRRLKDDGRFYIAASRVRKSAKVETRKRTGRLREQRWRSKRM